MTVIRRFEYIITDEIGIHARPAGLLVREIEKYESEITINYNGKNADASKLFAIMSLGVRKGEIVVVLIEGPDEQNASEKMEVFFKANF